MEENVRMNGRRRFWSYIGLPTQQPSGIGEFTAKKKSEERADWSPAVGSQEKKYGKCRRRQGVRIEKGRCGASGSQS